MAKETNKVQGLVKAVRKDKKGLLLDNDKWYSNKFFNGTVDCENGDKVEVEYEVNGNFLNLTKMTILQKGEKKAMQMEIRGDVNASQLTSYAKDLVVAAINRTDPKEKVDMQLLMQGAANAVSNAYLAIKDQITGVQAQKEAIKPVQPKQEKVQIEVVEDEEYEY